MYGLSALFLRCDITADCSNTQRPGWSRLRRRLPVREITGSKARVFPSCLRSPSSFSRRNGSRAERYYSANAPGESPPPDYGNNITSTRSPSYFPLCRYSFLGFTTAGDAALTNTCDNRANKRDSRGGLALLLNIFHFDVTPVCRLTTVS